MSVTWRLPFRVAESGLLEGRLVESEGGAPTIGRIRVTDAEGRYRPPLEADYGLVLRPRRDPARWSYASGNFRLRAPAGKIRISIRRGMEYLPIDEELELEAGRTLRRTFALKRWAHMEQEGWHSGDTHIHMLDPPSALFEMQAEDLRVGHVLVLEHMGKTYSREHFRGELDPISDPRHLVYYNQEYRNQTLGHVSLLSLKKLVEPHLHRRSGRSRDHRLPLFLPEALPQGIPPSRPGGLARRPGAGTPCGKPTGREGWSTGPTCVLRSSSFPSTWFSGRSTPPTS